jgi:hypothetical protein
LGFDATSRVFVTPANESVTGQNFSEKNYHSSAFENRVWKIVT